MVNADVAIHWQTISEKKATKKGKTALIFSRLLQLNPSYPPYGWLFDNPFVEQRGTRLN